MWMTSTTVNGDVALSECSYNSGGITRDQMLLWTLLNSNVTPSQAESGIPNWLKLSPHLCRLEIEVNIKCRNKSVFVYLIVHTLGILIIFEKSGCKTCCWDLKNWNKGACKVQKTSNFKPLGTRWENLKRSIVFKRESAFQKCFLNYIRM